MCKLFPGVFLVFQPFLLKRKAKLSRFLPPLSVKKVFKEVWQEKMKTSCSNRNSLKNPAGFEDCQEKAIPHPLGHCTVHIYCPSDPDPGQNLNTDPDPRSACGSWCHLKISSYEKMDTFFNFYLNKQLYVVSVFSLKVSINLIFCCGLITFKIGVHCTLFYFNFIVYSLCT